MSGRPAGRRAGGRAAARPHPVEPLSNRKQVLQSPLVGRLLPTPVRRGSPAPPPSPAPLLGGPAYLREAACPEEKEARGRVSRGGATSSWYARPAPPECCARYHPTLECLSRARNTAPSLCGTVPR